jgi:hypothetical protein
VKGGEDAVFIQFFSTIWKDDPTTPHNKKLQAQPNISGLKKKKPSV